MAGKTTVAVTEQEYRDIIQTLASGGAGFRPKKSVAVALMVEANLGLRIEDVLALKLSDMILDGDHRRLNITEQKTGKRRTFTVPTALYQVLQDYAMDNNIKRDELIFPFTERYVQKYLKLACEYLSDSETADHYRLIGTHSFRKFFAQDIYEKNGRDIMLVQKLLQHSSVAVTQKYLLSSQKALNTAIENHVNIISI